MPAQADEAARKIIAIAAAGAEQIIRLNIHSLLVLLDSLAETLPFNKKPFAPVAGTAHRAQRIARSGHLCRANVR
jgi:hypothetical protein